MTSFRQSLGQWGEKLAENYLNERGYRVTDRNVRTQYGELDLVALWEEPSDGTTAGDHERAREVVVFVEVKTRSSTAYGFPEEAVTPRKQDHLLKAAQAYLQAHPDLEDDWRIDVIAIQRSRSGEPPVITHFENAVP